MILRGMIAGLSNAGFFAALLLVPAGLVSGGAWRWPRALVFLAAYCVILEAAVIVLAVAVPASPEARLRGPVSRKQPVADRIVTAILMLSMIAWIIFIPPRTLLLSVVLTAKEMERHVGIIAHDPAIVTRRPRRNIEDCPGSQFVNRAIIHRRRCTARKHHSDVLHIATRRAQPWPDVNGPPPSRLIGRTADGHASQANDLESSLFENPHLVRCFKPLQNRIELRHICLRVSSNPSA